MFALLCFIMSADIAYQMLKTYKLMKVVPLSIYGVKLFQENRSHSLVEGSELLTEVSEDLLSNANLLSSSASAHLHARFESAANRQEIPADEYRKLLRGLNKKQRQ